MLHRTADTYKAAWLIMNGARLKDVEFINQFGVVKYTVVLEVADTRFLTFWNQHRPIGNIRRFAEARLYLKREIYEYKKAKMPAQGLSESSRH